MGWIGAQMRYLREEVVWEADDHQELSLEPGACRCTWDAAMGLLIDLNRHSAPTFIWVPAT